MKLPIVTLVGFLICECMLLRFERFVVYKLTFSMNSERRDVEMSKYSVKLKKRFVRKFTLHYLVLPFFFILALSIAFPSIASTEPSSAVMTLEKTVDHSSPKPGEIVNFTITYSNDMSGTAYNVTIFERIPSNLTFVSSKPFYDGVSDPETGFYRWSRGDIPPNENGTVIIKAKVDNVPVGTLITSTAHLAYQLENGTNVEVTSSETINISQAAGVDVDPDQIHAVAPHKGAWTEYNVTVKNIGNWLDTFSISLRSVAYNPPSADGMWTIELYNSTGYPQNPVATLYDDNVDNSTSWTDHGVLANVTLAGDESTWFMIRVTEPGGTSGNGDAYLDVHLIATSLFDSSISDFADEMTIVRSVTGITLGPDYSRYANPGDTVVYHHIVFKGGWKNKTEVVDIKYTSTVGWAYSFWFDDGTALEDTDGSGYVDIGELLGNDQVYVLVKVTVPYATAAGIKDTAVITATGVTSGNFDTAIDITTVKSAPILGVDKKLVSDNPIYVGDVVTYQINVTNLGNTRLIKVPLYDAFEPLSLSFSSADPAEDAYDQIAGTIHWENLTALESNQSIMVTVSFVAVAADDVVRESANVIDAEDEFGNLISATCMNKELRIIGVYTLTVTASPNGAIGGSFSVAWTERGVQKNGTFTTQKSISGDQDTVAEVSHPESPITSGDVRYIFTHYSPSATVTMDFDKTVTLNYRTEYNLTFQQTGSFEPVYITVNGTQLPGSLPQCLWVGKGSATTFSYSSPVTDPAGTTRYVLIEVSGNTTETSVTVNAPVIVTGFYKTQYHLNVTTDPVGLDTPQYSGWYNKGAYAEIEVATLTGGDGLSTRYRFDHWAGMGIKQYYITIISLHNDPTPSQWVNATENLTVGVTSPADDDGAGTRYRCTGYKIDDGDLEEATSYTFVDVQAAHKIEFEWIAQRYLTVNISPPDVPETIPGEGWYDENTLVSLTAPSPVSASNGVQYRFDHWTIDTTTSTTNPITFNMDAPKTVTAHYVKQFKLIVISDYDSPDPPLGDHWYDEGESITASVSSPADESNGTRYRCTGWSGTGSVPVKGTDTSLGFTITAPSSIVWNWIPQHQLTVDNGGHGTTTPTSGNWYDAGEWITITMGSDTTSNSTGTRYLFALWSGSGPGSYSGPTNPCQVQINGPITEAASWKTQHYLTVNSPYGTPDGAGWYDSDSAAYATLDTETVSAGSGIRYVFTQWGEDASGTDYAQSDPITMNAPKTATANWKRQYYLTVISAYRTPSGTGWYDDGSITHAGLDRGLDSGETGIRYVFTRWSGDTSGIDFTQSDPIVMDAPKTVNASWKTQYYLTMSTNFGDTTPHNGWYDVGSIVSIEATAPAVAEGNGYVWHGWTGTSEGSYSGVDNPATVTMNSAISETAYWKIDPLLTIMISNDTITSGDRIVVHGKMLPVNSTAEISVIYVFPNGTQIEHRVYTDDEGNFEDTLLMDQEYLYGLFVDDGEWMVAARRSSDINHEKAQTSTTLRIDAPPVVQFHPGLLAWSIVAVALIAYVPTNKKVKNNNTRWHATVILCCAGLIFGAVSLALNWVLVTGIATTNNVTYQVNILLYPLGNGLVSITEGLRYTGAEIPSMVDPSWRNIIGSTGPVLTLYLVPLGCALALTGFYKPKTIRKRSLKTVILLISGGLILTSVVHTLIFVQGQASAIDGAAVGYNIGVYLAIISGTLAVLAGLFANREIHTESTKANMS